MVITWDDVSVKSDQLCVLLCFNMCHSMHERITRYIDGEVYTMHESLMVISQAILSVEALVDEIGQSSSYSTAAG